jgi:hypothetical protein
MAARKQKERDRQTDRETQRDRETERERMPSLAAFLLSLLLFHETSMMVSPTIGLSPILS